MEDNIRELLKKYNITGSDLNKIYYFCVANKKDEAIRFLQPKTEWNCKISELIVNSYLEDKKTEIAETAEQLDNYRAKQLSETIINQPKCPTCGSANIEKISIGKKAVGGALFGILSSDVRNTMHCKNCGYKW